MWLMARARFYDFLLPRLTLRVQLLNPRLFQLRAPLRISPLIKRSASRTRLALPRRHVAFSLHNQRPTNEKHRNVQAAKTNSSAC